MLNQTILEAAVVRSEGLKYSARGSAYLSLTLVFETLEKKEGQWNAKKNFIRATLWGKQAERLDSRLKPGSSLILRGKLEQKSWTDTEGKKKSVHSLVIDEIHFSRKPQAKMYA